MTVIHIIGVGLDGRAGLAEASLGLIDRAILLVGSARLLSYFPEASAERWPLDDLKTGIEELKHWLAQATDGFAVVLASGDPLFFGVGRLLVESLPPEQLVFHPHLSSVQLAFSRLKLPWQTATVVSAHGRSPEGVLCPLRRGDSLVAVLTDPTHTPARLGQLLLALDLPYAYRLWVCENLGGNQERVQCFAPEAIVRESFAPLNVVVFQRSTMTPAVATLPLFGLPDAAFASFDDRPGLMTKRDMRLQILGDLALHPRQVVWDVGAGTGSVSVEINRLCPDSQVYAVEKTAAGIGLIQTNRERLGNENLHPIHGTAPGVLSTLPDPHRVFIGGSGGQLTPLLDTCAQRLYPQGRMVLALATLEHLSTVVTWVQAQTETGPMLWSPQYRQLQVHHSVPVGPLTRWQPLTPITVVTLQRT